MAEAIRWVYRLLDKRLWLDRPVCVGAMIQMRRVYAAGEIGTEIILQRSGA